MRNRRNFTLVELLVSLGVFSILLILFMQLFSGMRLTWMNTEKRNETYGNVRTAMNMMSTLLGSLYYSSANSDGKFLFLIENPESDNSRIFFASKADIGGLRGSNPIRFIGVWKDGTNVYLNVLANDNDDYICFFPEFLKTTDRQLQTYSGALTDLKTQLHTTTGALKLLENVMEFSILAVNNKGEKLEADTLDSVTGIKSVPAELEVRFTVLSENDFAKWNELTGNAKDNFKLANQRSFTRRIFIGNDWRVEEKYDKYP